MNPCNMGLIGYLFDTSLAGPDIREPDVCEMAAEIRKKIWCKLREIQLSPNQPVEIDGEKWAPDRLVEALMKLYDWTFMACAHEDPGVAIISSNTRCGRGGCGC